MKDERPWGSYEIIEQENPPVCVKILTINPLSKLSLQTHSKRTERWYILDAGIRVTVGEFNGTVEPGWVVTVEPGQQHRIENTSRSVARIVELMYGEYDEDDIVRIEDDYGR